MGIFFEPGYEIKRMLREREISCKELTDLFLNRIKEEDRKYNAFLYVDTDGAKKEAEAVDKLSGTKILQGIPVVVPDVLDMKHTPTTFGSLMLKQIPTEEEALEITHLKESGAVILGKTNVAEFGLSYETKNRLKEPTRNPWNVDYSPGGGAAGGAVAVAAGMATMALMTDFNGALRMSCSFCGIPGLMPTRGRVPTVRSHSLLFTEQMFYRKGAAARTVRDVATLLNELAQPDNRDTLCLHTPPEDYETCIEKKAKPLKIAWSPNLDFLPVDPEVHHRVSEGAKRLEELGHHAEEVTIGIEPDMINHFLHLFSADRYIMIMRILETDPSHLDELADYTPKWLQMGDSVTGVQYALSLAYTHYLQNTIDKLLKKYDLLLTPTVPVPPYPHGEVPECVDGQPIDPYVGLWGFLLPFNMTGHPAMTLPCGLSKEGLPIGMQIVGRYFEEDTLLTLAHTYERQFPFAKR